MKLPRLIYTLMTLLLFSACGGSDDQPGPIQAPQLQFPENNSECLEGIVSSTNPELSTIEFRWSAASNASGYELNIKNLETGQDLSRSTNNTLLPVELDRGTPYSWSVTANSASAEEGSAQSETWKFFNAGEGINSYTPFPADLIFPRSGASISLNGTGTIELRWEGADIDNDITDYEVFFDTNTPPTISAGNTGTNRRLSISSLTAGTTYYWRVITTDSQGNSSASEVSEFRVAN